MTDLNLTDISANATERHLTETIKAKRQAMGINPHACRFVFFLFIYPIIPLFL